MKKEQAIAIVIGFIVLWYCGAMLDFFPFTADIFAVKAIGYTGLLLCIVIVYCTYRIISEIKKK